jgi:uncharacterized repeat protein (TIGR01451 family)
MQSRLLAVLALAGLLSACGGGGGGGGSDTGPVAGGDRVSLTASGSTAPVPSVANTDLDFVVANPGTVTANNVALTVTLGAGLTKAGVQCVATNASCPSDPNTSMQVDGLPPGGSLHFKMSVIPEAGASGTITSTAAVSATNDEVTSNNSAQVGLSVYSAEVSVIGSTSESELFSGSTVTYSLTLSNAGPDAARNVQLENTLSSGQSMTAMTCTASGGATCPTTGATMTIPTLPGGGSLTFSVTALLSMQTVISVSDTLRIITSPGDAIFGNNTATASVATRIPTSTDSPSFMELRSDEGDYVGAGGSYSYTNENAVFEVFEANPGLLSFKLMGDEDWSGFFYMPQGMTQIQKGTYTDLIGAPFHDPATGGFYLSGGSRTCGPHSDWFKIDDVVYAAGQITSIDIRFEQHCNGSAPGLRGQLHWNANDATRPPGPVNPPPAGLWQPAPGATPASGNYVYITSDPLDFIGEGRTETYTQVNSILTVRSETTGELGVGMNGNRQYGVTFKAMVPLTRVEAGYYPDAQRWPFGNPALGMMTFGGDGRGCNVLTGWFVIDSITYSGNDVTALDARFEQHCEGRPAASRGKIHWRSDDPTQPAGPQVPPPAGLWTPPAGSVPATGNVVYLQSENDFIGQGITKAYTPLDSVIEVGGGGMTPAGNRFQLTVRGDEEWTGFFQAMSTLSDLQPGYYGNLQRFPGNNPVYGGIAWYGEGRGCNTATGWFVIDSVTYSGNTLDSIELRFEQHCEGFTPALHGLVRWSAADTRQPLPPQVPPPANLWAPPSGATPASGNYFYQESEAGDFVGDGQTHLYTSLDAVINMTVTGSQLNVDVLGDLRWGGLFIPMVPLTQLQVGYYDLHSGSNVAKGVFTWHGDGRGCNDSLGWFVVDDVSYASGSLTSLDLRFEQKCGTAAPALHGKIHWRADDPTQPPGPQNPPPPGLWTPAPGATPATGNFFYLQSEPGDYMGQGQTHLFTASDTFESATFPHEFIVGIHPAGGDWAAHFDNMSSIPRLQPGYYPNVQRLFLHNPTVGGMDIHGQGRNCEVVDGWFVIDSVTYTGTTVTAIDVKFEQKCNNGSAALHGRIRWSQ